MSPPGGRRKLPMCDASFATSADPHPSRYVKRRTLAGLQIVLEKIKKPEIASGSDYAGLSMSRR